MSGKTRILQSALQLTAIQGPDAATTRQIADSAGVSEALIFKHFKSKDGLMEALAEQVDQALSEKVRLYPDDDPRSRIKYVMELPFLSNNEEEWRCYYKLYWSQYRPTNKLLSIIEQDLEDAYTALGMPQAKLEAQLALSYMHGFFFSAITEQCDSEEILRLLRTKYA